MEIAKLLLALSLGMLLWGKAQAESEKRVLFEFTEPSANKQWQTVNDGVMGGRSEGRFQIDDDRMKFYGTLSLENNGGFASVRSAGRKLELTPGDVLVLRVRGDGRQYSFNLYPSRRLTAFSYRAEFKTKQDEWIEVRIPLSEFVATSFGRTLPDRKLDPKEVSGLGILLGDKKPGPFQLEIDWIQVHSGS